MTNSGIAFENAVERIYQIITHLDQNTKVTQNELIAGPDGSRQFDVVLRTSVADETYLTVIECKDFSRAVNVTAVDAFHSKMREINASKGILLCRKGFSRTATQKAVRLGISLVEIDSLANNLEDPLSHLPIVVRQILPETIGLGLRSDDLPSELDSITFSADSFISGLPISQLLGLIEFEPLLKNDELWVEITEETLGRPIWFHNKDGKECILSKVTFSAKLSKGILFGYAHMLPSAMKKTKVHSGKMQLFLDASDFAGIKEGFVSYKSFSEIPSNLVSNHLAVISIPSEFSYSSFQLFGQRTDSKTWEAIRS